MSPRTWSNERTVQSVLTDSGYYEEGSKADLQAKYVEEEQVDIGGKNYTLSKISKLDVKIFANQMDTRLSRVNPFIWDVFAKRAVHCLAAIRLANIETGQGYKGAGGHGNELDSSLLNARQFADPDALPARRTNWIRAVAGAGPLVYMCALAAPAAPIIMTQWECFILLGFYNPATTPLLDMFQITLNTDLFDWQDVDFDMVDVEETDVIFELKEPWILPPREAGLITVTYNDVGTDETRPLGLWVKQASAMRAMATP